MVSCIKIFLFVLAGAAVGLPAIALAAASDVFGYAWSENIGWINFNGANYGVNISPSNGRFSGYAWSENIGWITFNQNELNGCPSGQCRAEVDLATGHVSGWARALANGGGWDGWIKLRGTNYGVSINTGSGAFSGFAWSNMVIGWISFSGSGYGVTAGSGLFNSPPNKPNIDPAYLPDGISWNNCSFQGKSTPTFHWMYSDPDRDAQSAYEIEVDDNSSFNAPKFNRLVNLAATSYVLDLSQDDPPADWISQLAWDTNYFWRARVKDDKGNWSVWSNSIGFKTSKHAYPYPDFNWQPAGPVQGEVISFNPDISQTFGGSSISTYSWTITQGTGQYMDGTTNNSRYPHIIFSTPVNKAKLQVTDDTPGGGYSCESSEKSITAELPLPEYREIRP